MSKPLLTSRKALVAVVLLLLLSSLLPSRFAKWIGSLPTTIAESLSVPVSHPVSWASHKLRAEDRGPVENITQERWAKEKEEYDRLNRELWAINRDLRESLAAFEAIALIRDPKDIRPIEAAVINFNNDRNNPVMLISQGTRAGVTGGDPVVYRTNLLGFVEKEPGLLNCKVELMNLPGRRIRVAMQPVGAVEYPWPVIEYAIADDNGQTFHCDRPIDHPLEVGHIAWVYDDLHEQAYGFLLGRIVAIEDHPDKPYELDRIVIRPDVPIGPQGRVMVITEREE